jgi:hypothetical protein
MTAQLKFAHSTVQQPGKKPSAIWRVWTVGARFEDQRMAAYKPVSDCVPWSDADLSALRQLVGLELPMAFIAQRLRRSTSAVRRKAHGVAIADMMQCPTIHHGLAFQPRGRTD